MYISLTSKSETVQTFRLSSKAVAIGAVLSALDDEGETFASGMAVTTTMKVISSRVAPTTYGIDAVTSYDIKNQLHTSRKDLRHHLPLLGDVIGPIFSVIIRKVGSHTLPFAEIH